MIKTKRMKLNVNYSFFQDIQGLDPKSFLQLVGKAKVCKIVFVCCDHQ